MKKIDKHYVSHIDKQLVTFRKLHPNSPSQQDEINKYQRLYTSRDNVNVHAPSHTDDIWNNF